MKMLTVREKFKKQQKLLQCPLCGKSGFFTKTGSFLCKKGHCFDLSKKGYLNFLPQQKPLGNYDQTLFECRGRIYADGFYAKVVSELQQIVETHRSDHRRASFSASDHAEIPAANRQPMTILDTGCGEGYYAYALGHNVNFIDTIFGMDIAKEAIVLAAKKDCPVNWMVADLTDIPLRKNSVDVLLNILTPANYSEFHRILADDGILVKVIPGRRYLTEIREHIAAHLQTKAYSPQPVTDYFNERITLLEKRTLCYELPVSQEQRNDFLHMTPLTYGINLSAIDFQNIDRITIHFDMLVGTKNTNRLHHGQKMDPYKEKGLINA